MPMNRKAFRTACSFFTLAGCFAAPTAHAAPYISLHGYSITPPPGWHLSTTRSTTRSRISYDVVFECTKNIAVDGAPNLSVDVKPISSGGGVTLERLAPAIALADTKHFPGSVIKSETYSLLGGVRDLDIVVVIRQRGTLLRFRQVFVLKSGSSYVFTAICPEKAHAKYDPAVAQMLNSVRWKS